jgi:2-polyprenyl-3-methyl-5-hydroxy-6-metoxy-1,4-benzoquinol methylase
MKGWASDTADRVLTSMGFADSESKRIGDSKRFWTSQQDDDLQNQTHTRSGSAMRDGAWEQVGRDHLALFKQMLSAPGVVNVEPRYPSIVEWGVGGGSNAVAFSPLGQKFYGVDLTQEIVDEAAYQVAQSTGSPFVPVVLDMEHPGRAWQEIGKADLFLCLYVLELVPSQEHGLDIMTLAHQMLNDDGLAFVQIKYDTGSWRTRSRGRRYRRSIAASMTTYPIHEFWELMVDVGFEPLGVYLVPRNELDERYAYFLLRKPALVK